MIEVSALTHRYGPLTAVGDLSFEVRRGEILGLLGPNGAGKTTTMRSIVGLLTPTEGRISIDGHDLATEPLAARRLLGYLPENVPLYLDLTVEEFLAFAARAKGLAGGAVRQEIDRVVEICGLGEMRRRLLGYCSRGYRQRAGLAQALVGDPPVLILDEPTVGLDPSQVVDIRDRVATLARDKAVILSTHILPEASRLCSRVLILDRGRRRAEGTPQELASGLGGGAQVVLRATPDDTVRAVIEESAAVTLIATEADARYVVECAADAVPPLVAALAARGCAVSEVRPRDVGLEDVFLQLVRQEAHS